MHSDVSSLTEGVIWKRILLFAFPIFLGNVFQQFYNTFDSWAVGNFLGDNALAAVSSSGSLIFLLVGFFNGLSMGAGIIIARYYGAKDYDALRKSIHTTVASGLIIGVILTVIGVTFTPTILRWMGTPEDVFPDSVEYFRFYFYGAFFVVMYNIFVGILQSVGDSRHPLYYLIISSIVNIVLDLLLVGVFHMGVWAAALATTISQGLSALLCFLQLVRCDAPYKLKVKEIKIYPSYLKQVASYGFPAAIQNSVIAFANIVVQTSINSFGKAAMAGCGSYSKLEGFSFLTVTCFSQALATFVGQNLGAEKFDRVKHGVKFGILASLISTEIIGVISWIFAPTLISLFNDQPEVVSFGTVHMRTICLFYFLLAFTHCIAGILRGAGKVKVPMFIMLGCWCLLRVTYITIGLHYRNQLTTISWAYPITWACSSILFFIYFLKVDWIHNFSREKNISKAES